MAPEKHSLKRVKELATKYGRTDMLYEQHKDLGISKPPLIKNSKDTEEYVMKIMTLWISSPN